MCEMGKSTDGFLADTFYVLGGSELVGYAVESEESH